ncbi:hypothetical protein QBC46DRAFT_371415 [Diplogelasinospora grovesii]|uniref:Uncharacterized protein n=1 Tax=Diplogelasinospora grovesii TaxID=303347 RepID=A0AAN6NJ17_9PEZI|nr:hypothetical protein QBC46DRAFT_371415 [Diplogelasinospora grovesii]
MERISTLLQDGMLYTCDNSSHTIFTGISVSYMYLYIMGFLFPELSVLWVSSVNRANPVYLPLCLLCIGDVQLFSCRYILLMLIQEGNTQAACSLLS